MYKEKISYLLVISTRIRRVVALPATCLPSSAGYWQRMEKRDLSRALFWLPNGEA
jgi:hypothetical protein